MYRSVEGEAVPSQGPKMSLTFALSAYIILIGIVAPAEILGPLHKFLGSVKLSLMFPEITTSQVWVNAAGLGKKISVFDLT